MKELEETNCEISNIVNFELPLWDVSNNLASQKEPLTIDGLKELNIQTTGGFLSNDCKYAWISYDTRLVVIDIKCGKFVTSWNFPNKITSVCPFPVQPGQVPLLLVGLDNNAIRIKDSIGYLCIFDCCTSTILTTIEVPAGVEKAYVIHGGEEWEKFNEKRPDTVLSGNTGLIFAALRNLQHVVIDINRSLWQNFPLEGKSITAKLEFVNNSSTWQTSVNKSKKEPTHLAYDLMDKEIEQHIGFDRNDFESTPLYDENLCSVLLSSIKIGCLITGCLGRVIIWHNDGSIGWISPTFDENAYVTHVALLEPSDDPRPFYYLWIACQSDSSESSAVLRMYTMLFNKKHCHKAGESSLYFNLESEPSLKFELELEQGERVHSLLSVERESLRDPSDMGSRRGEDSLLFIGTDERLLMFDLNRWYKEQMPRTMAECRNPNSVMASYRTKSEELAKRDVIACSYVPRSLREFPTKGPSSPEELFYPNSLTLGWVELAMDNLLFWLARGVQSELLREITIAGPIVIVKPTETYRRCLTAGLVPFDSSPQDYIFDADKSQQREMLLSLCLEQRWANFLIRCASEWSDGSAVYLYPEFLRWGVQRASELKLIADRLCVPLFDQSGTNIGESEVKTLRFCCQQLECLTTVVLRLPNLESDLEKQRRALKRIATYLQVLLWFYDVGLLPEIQKVEEEDEMPQISMSMKIPYPRDKLMEIYKKKRGSDENNGNKEETLFIHQLVSQECLPIRAQWEREAGNDCPNHGGYYPPPSLQSLLRSFLMDCHQDEYDNVGDDECDMAEMDSKHSITIYLLMDLAMLLQSSHRSVDRLIKYPSAFKLSPSLIKITQAFWLLDHDDFEGFFKIITGQLILPNDIKDWHHKIAIKALLKNDEHKLALIYLRVLKPPLSSLEDQGTMIGLAVERNLVESAFHARPSSHYAQLLTKFFEACKAHGKLKEILHLSLDNEEEEAFVKFLKEGGCEDTRLLYFLQRCRHTETSDIFAFDTSLNSRRSGTPKTVHPTALKILSAFNATLPEVTKRFASNFMKSNGNYFDQYHNQQPFLPTFADSNSDGSVIYPRPMSQCRNQVNEIYDIAMNKTRETCFKTERGVGAVNHIPFLGAPCSTVSFYSKAATTNGLMEQSEANCVTFAERKSIKGKRTMRMNDNEENFDGKTEIKRRRFDSDAEMSTSTLDTEERPQRRLSMSQVCNTPLIQRKIQPTDGKDPNSLAADTPHSILKIRQILRRNSNSPSYNYRNGSPNEREIMLQRSISGESRPTRQIRFSMDRFSTNDDSVFSVNDSNREYNEPENGKNIDEECSEENYYSPNMSAKSIRDVSILTDTSFTKYIRGLRPRPSLRRSSLISRASSESLSQKTSLSDTVDVSALDTSFERNRKISNISPRKSALSPPLYSASILSSNTSIEGSPVKRPLTLNNNEDNGDEDVTEESEVETEDDTAVADFNDKGVDKDSSIEPTSLTKTREKEEVMKENEWNDEFINNEVETQDEEEDDQEKSISVSCNLARDNEVSEDEDEEIEIEPEPEGSFEMEKDLDEEDCDQDEDTFQSFSNSTDYAPNSPSKMSTNYVDEPDDNCESNYTHPELQHSYRNQNYSATDNFVVRNNSPQYSDTSYCDYQRNSHSLTRPIFIDNQGIVKYDSVCDITDDESTDDDFTALTPHEVDEEEAESTLNVSSSDGCEDILKNKNRSEKSRKLNGPSITGEDEEENSLQKMASFRSELSDTLPGSDLTNASFKSSEVNINRSMDFQSQFVTNELNDDSSPSKRITRKQSAISRRIPRARRSIKSVSTNSLTRANEFMESIIVDREKRSTSVTKEVKKILSQVVREPVASTLSLEQNILTEEDKISVGEEEKEEEKNPTLKSSKTSTEFVPEESENSSMISRKENDESTMEKNPSKAVPKRSTRGSQKDKNQTSTTEFTESLKQRVTRLGSVTTKELDKPARKTRASSIAKETMVFQSSLINEDSSEEIIEKKTNKSKATKPSSIAKESKMEVSTKSDTEKSEALEESQEVNKDRTRRANSSKVSSLSKDTKGARKKRSGSVGQDEDESMVLGTRRTRASSLSKGSNTAHEKIVPTRRMTRASSLAKETSITEMDETLGKRGSKKRGSSLPKDISIGSEPGRLQSRNRRSTSLLKEVILEESFSHLDSPVGLKRTRMQRCTEDGVASSPAGNTRSRRSSVQSIPEELEDILSVPASVRSAELDVDEGRARRAGSVDSSLVIPAGKRMTRSVLAKATVIPEVIPEEAGTTKSTSKRQPGRRRRAASVSSENLESGDAVEKTKTKSRKGRKVSESKDFLFSLPEEAGHLPPNAEDDFRTPTYTFSEPTGLHKFISPICDDEESSDVTTNLSRSKKTNNKNIRSSKIQLRPRKCFAVSKNTKDKTK